MINKNLSDSNVICTECVKENSWERFFETKDDSTFTGACSFCGGKLIIVDSLFVPICNVLWTKGYRTRFHCLGHKKTNYGKEGIPYLYFEEEYPFHSVPKNWEFRGDKNTTMYYKGTNFLKSYIFLKKWAKQLPKAKKEKQETELRIPSQIDKPHESNIIIYCGENSFNRIGRSKFRDYIFLKDIKEMSAVKKKNKKNKIVISARDLIKFAFELEANPFSSKNEIIIVFPMFKEKEDNFIPFIGRGVAPFKNLSYYGLYKYLVSKFNPEIFTGDKRQVYKIK